ncbi:MAG TPA: hypothetical protein VF033_14760 [Steroidobacteraceae bacterium]
MTPPNETPTPSHAWYGSEALAVRLPVDGRWQGMGPTNGYRDKLWFWRRGYTAAAETEPALTIDAENLDDSSAERVHIDRATNAFGPGWARILTALEFPSAGCWRVQASYVYLDIRQELTFVVDVGPSN